MVRQAHLIALVGTFLIGCAVLLAVGCAGVRSGAPKEKQGQAEDIKQEQGRSPEATAAEEARCGGTRSIHLQERTYTTNDIPGCPNKGGLLLGTDKAEKISSYGGPYLGDKLAGEDGDDEIRGLGANDWIFGGLGSDVIYGGDGHDLLEGGTYEGNPDESSKDVLHGGPGKDDLTDFDGGDDVLYGGDGDDKPLAGGAGEDVIYGGDGNDFIDAVSASIAGFRITKERPFVLDMRLINSFQRQVAAPHAWPSPATKTLAKILLASCAPLLSWCKGGTLLRASDRPTAVR